MNHSLNNLIQNHKKPPWSQKTTYKRLPVWYDSSLEQYLTRCSGSHWMNHKVSAILSKTAWKPPWSQKPPKKRLPVWYSNLLERYHTRSSGSHWMNHKVSAILSKTARNHHGVINHLKNHWKFGMLVYWNDILPEVVVLIEWTTKSQPYCPKPQETAMESQTT